MSCKHNSVLFIFSCLFLLIFIWIKLVLSVGNKLQLKTQTWAFLPNFPGIKKLKIDNRVFEIIYLRENILCVYDTCVA